MCHRFLCWHRRPGAGDCNAGAAARGDASRFPRLAPPPLFPRRFGSAPRPESPLAARGEESYTSDRPSLVHGGTSMTRARPASTPPPRPAGTPLPGGRPTRRRWRALAFPVALSVTGLAATAPPACTCAATLPRGGTSGWNSLPTRTNALAMLMTTLPRRASSCSRAVVAAESHGVASTMTSHAAASTFVPPCRSRRKSGHASRTSRAFSSARSAVRDPMTTR